MIVQDAINGTFELLAGCMVLNHCRVMVAERGSVGVSLVSVLFFALWGFWNLYYYPQLDQPISTLGGVGVVIANLVQAWMIWTHRRKRRATPEGAPAEGALHEGEDVRSARDLRSVRRNGPDDAISGEKFHDSSGRIVTKSD